MTTTMNKFRSSTMKSFVQEITPTLAEKMLDRNTNNRTPRKAHITRLARMMKGGTWAVTPQGIAFDTDGKLSDGQHRLLAVVLSGETIQMMVTVGVDPNAQKFLDQGSVRSIKDVREFSGLGDIKYGTCCQGVARLMLLWEEGSIDTVLSQGQGGRTRTVEAFEVTEWLLEFSEEAQLASAQAYRLKQDIPGASVNALAFFVMLFNQRDEEFSKEFFNRIAGNATGAGDPVVALNRALNRNKTSLYDQLPLFIDCWNFCKENKENIRFPRRFFGDPMPQPL